jgi:hypothetical protein
MVSWKDEITDPANTISSKFGGITINHILQYFKAVDLAVGGTDPTGNADIATETIFANEALKLWDSNKSHKIKFQTPDYTESKTWTFPSEAAMGASDEVMFKDSVQIVTNKTNTFSGNQTFDNGSNIVLGTGTGTKIGTGTTQKVGFFNATPVVRQSAIANVDTGTVDTSWGTPEVTVVTDIRTKLNSVLTILRNLGLIAP